LVEINELASGSLAISNKTNARGGRDIGKWSSYWIGHDEDDGDWHEFVARAESISGPGRRMRAIITIVEVIILIVETIVSN
jgi:hypothetical protein